MAELERTVAVKTEALTQRDREAIQLSAELTPAKEAKESLTQRLDRVADLERSLGLG